MSLRRLGLVAPVVLLVLLCSPLPGTCAVCEVPAESQCATEFACPSFENRLETEHFVLQWTNRSSHAADNVCNPEVVGETAGYLEAAWDKLTGLFGRTPYLPPGSSKIGVIFHDLDCYAYADPPDGPIELNSSVWMRMPSIRQSTSAHELFHKLQYAYGYKTRWPPRKPLLWFTEGTAAWAEVFVWGRVTRDCKIEGMFYDPGMDLYDAEDMALPFWIYFVSGNSGVPKDRLMVKFFEKYEEENGNANAALLDVIRDSYGSADSFFRRFAHERKNDFWPESVPQSCNYTRIMGPDGKDLVAEIKKYQRERHELSGKSTKAS
jgi:hypothetical protein